MNKRNNNNSNNRNNYSQNNKGNNQNNRNNNSGNRGKRIRKFEKETMPSNYIDQAEELVVTRIPTGYKTSLTTTKLRKFLNYIIDIYNQEVLRADKELTKESIQNLQLAQMRMLYEAGRDKDSVKKQNRDTTYMIEDFLRDFKLINYLKDIEGNREKFLDYTHYLEAIVAFFKFYIGKED